MGKVIVAGKGKVELSPTALEDVPFDATGKGNIRIGEGGDLDI